jgi:acyl carrier protein
VEDDVDKSIEQTVKGFIMKEFLPGENPDELTDSTPLITGGILDSLATLKLVAFIEDQYAITLQAHEADAENLNTLTDIGNLVRSKA